MSKLILLAFIILYINLGQVIFYMLKDTAHLNLSKFSTAFIMEFLYNGYFI